MTKLKQKTKYPVFRARPHMVSQIMGGIENKPITEIQLKKIETLENKKTPLTDLQAIDLTTLIAKRDAGRFNLEAELSVGAITVAHKFMREFLYQRKAPKVKTNLLDKGIEMEDGAIEYVNKILKTDYKNNEETFENDFLEGTPDIITADSIFDIKNSWTFMTHPLWDNEAKTEYVWQLMGYYALTGKKKGGLIHTLMSTPLEIIEKEYWKIEGENPKQEVVSDKKEVSNEYTPHFLEFAKDYQYEDIDSSLRIKRIPVEYDEEMVQAIKNRVEKINEYINNYE